jgi:hypothetical protein
MKKLFSLAAVMMTLLSLQLHASSEYIVLIDYSKSISKADQKIYKQTLGSVLGKIGEQDRISLVNIGKSDMTNFTIFDEFTAAKGSTNKVKIHNKKGLRALWKRFLNKPFETENATKIISSIRGAQQRFDSSTSDEKVLIILSDMIDSTKESKGYQFAKNKACDSVPEVIQNISKPKLNDVKVYVAGAGGEGDTGYQCLKTFWTEFFVQSSVKPSDLVYQRINPFN